MLLKQLPTMTVMLGTGLMSNISDSYNDNNSANNLVSSMRRALQGNNRVYGGIQGAPSPTIAGMGLSSASLATQDTRSYLRNRGEGDGQFGNNGDNSSRWIRCGCQHCVEKVLVLFQITIILIEANAVGNANAFNEQNSVIANTINTSSTKYTIYKKVGEVNRV